ncbi:MAG: bacterial Ig-like domain-containing protein [Clostridia bacterium]|nr:bacterial Ig-like domain-containing protein [Clostridia bacterium]
MNNKKTSKKLLMLVLVVSLMALVLSLTSCKEKITDIYISNVNPPRSLYVEGQDLDLTTGYLSVVMKNGEEAKLALNAEGVSVSGYDKYKLGEQTITVSHGDLTTSFTITVIPRMVAEGYETLYFVGDKFDKEKGRVKIASDDGSTFTVNMNDFRVSVASFDSSKTGIVAVKLAYDMGDAVYETTFNVTVYEHENVSFTAPPEKNNSYLSHEKGGVNVSGGYFTIVSADGRLTKKVNLTQDMVKGFDLSVATMANRTNPYEQTLTIEYLPGITFQYNIKITFSDIDVVNYYANGILSDIIWNEDVENLLTEEQMAGAIDALGAYYNLTPAEKKLLDAECVNLVARAGTIAAQSEFAKELVSFEDTFGIDENLNIYLNKMTTFDAVAEDIVRLKDKDADINLYAKYLQNLKADFEDTILAGDKTIGDYILVYPKDVYDALVEIIAHMVSVYEGMKDIPENWTNDDLVAYADAILGATLQINSAGYYKNGTGGFYTEVLSKWRAKDDFFDILYAYFLYEYEDGVKFISTNMLGSVPLPGLLDDWHASLSQSVIYIENYINYYNEYLRTGNKNYLAEIILDDTSPMMYYFFETMEKAQAVKSSTKTLYLDLYRAIEGDSINHLYMYGRDFGYLYQVGGLDNAPAFNALWDSYNAVLKLYLAGELSKDTHASELALMFEYFSSLTPTELFGFLNTINLLYAKTDFAIQVLSYTDTSSYNTFVKILKEYYLPNLNEVNKPLFAKLLLAMEHYAIIGHKEGALAEFVTLMAEITDAYGKLSPDDQKNFDDYLGTAYAQYSDIYALTLEGALLPTLTTEENALLEELLASLKRYYALHAYMSGLTDRPTALFGVLYASFVEADACYNAFMKVASRDAKAYLFYKTYTIGNKEQTLLCAFYEVDSITTEMLNARSFELTSITDGSKYHQTAWELLKSYDMMPLLSDLAKLLYYGYDSTAVSLTDEEVISLMTRVRALEGLQYSIFTMLYQDEAYYNALDKYFEENMSESGYAIAQNLMDAEKAYFKGENKAFLSTMESLIPAWEAHENAEDKALLLAMYNYYKAKMA